MSFRSVFLLVVLFCGCHQVTVERFEPVAVETPTVERVAVAETPTATRMAVVNQSTQVGILSNVVEINVGSGIEIVNGSSVRKRAHGTVTTDAGQSDGSFSLRDLHRDGAKLIDVDFGRGDTLTINGVAVADYAAAEAALEATDFFNRGGGGSSLTLSADSLAAGHSIVDEVLDIDGVDSLFSADSVLTTDWDTATTPGKYHKNGGTGNTPPGFNNFERGVVWTHDVGGITITYQQAYDGGSGALAVRRFHSGAGTWSEWTVYNQQTATVAALTITSGFNVTTYAGGEEVIFLTNKSASNQFIQPFFSQIEPDQTLAFKLDTAGNYVPYLDFPSADYDHRNVNGDFDLTAYDGDARLFTTSNTTGFPLTVTYGTPLAPLTIVVQEGETQTFVDNGVTGWQLLVVTHDPLTLEQTGVSRGYSIENQKLTIPKLLPPIASAAELETILQGKLHGVYLDGVTDLSSNSNDNANELAPAPVNADGSLRFVGNASRIAIDTNGANSEVSIFASVRPSVTQFTVFGGASNTFIPLSANATVPTTDVSRLDGVSGVSFLINGESDFASRSEVQAALPTGRFSFLEVPGLANGSVITIGAHQTNTSFSFIGDLARYIVVNDVLNDSQRLAVESVLTYGFTEARDMGEDITTQIVSGSTVGSFPNGSDHTFAETFTANATGVATIRYTAAAVLNAANSSAHIRVEDPNGVAVLPLTGFADRLTPTLLEREYDFSVVEGVTYTVIVGAGGGSTVVDPSFEIRLDSAIGTDGGEPAYLVDEQCYDVPAGISFTGEAVEQNNGDMLVVGGAVAPNAALLRLTNGEEEPIQINAIRVRFGANGFTGNGLLTIGGVTYEETAQEDLIQNYGTIVFSPVADPLVVQPGDSFSSQGNWGATIGPFQGPVISQNAIGSPFGTGNQARASINYTVGTPIVEIQIVRTFSDEAVQASKQGETTFVDVSEGVPDDWTLRSKVGEPPTLLERETVFDVTGVTATGTTLQINPLVSEANPPTGGAQIFNGLTRRTGTEAKHTFDFYFDDDDAMVLDFSAVFPANARITGLVAVADDPGEDPYADIGLTAPNSTSIRINRADGIDADVFYRITVWVDGYPLLGEFVVSSGDSGGSIELGPNATAEGITIVEGVLETPTTSDVARGRYELTEQSLSGQPAGNGQFPFSEAGLTHFSSSVSDNGDNTYTITTRGSPWLVTADTKTVGLTGNTNRATYIHDVSAVEVTDRIATSTDGRFGNGQTDIPATATIPPNTTITIEVRSVSSGGTQVLAAGASIDFTEIDTSHEALTLSPEAITAGYSLDEQELSVPAMAYQNADPVSYVDAAGDGFTVLAYSDGTFTTIDKNREYIVGLQSLPPDFVEFTELAPSLSNEQAFPNFFYQDVNTFIYNSQQNVNGATLTWELFIEGVDFELSNVTVFLDNNDSVLGSATVVSQQQPDGTFNHRITSDQPVAAFQPIRIRGDVTAGGLATGGGAGTEPDYLQFYSN